MTSVDIGPHYLGVMLGLAIGDALGAPVEFESLSEILAHRGDPGVADFEPHRGLPPGSYTDDTQMSIATARGTLDAHVAGAFGSTAEAAPRVWAAYQDWRETQDDPHQRRAPGSTCLSALRSGVMGTPDIPLNNGKGCGTIMRIAPCALLYPDDPFDWALACGAMTHSHPTGYFSGAAFALILHEVLNGKSLESAIEGARDRLQAQGFEADETRAVLETVLDQHRQDMPLHERIINTGAKGEGWVAEETLGIALSCALVHPTDFSAAVLAAVNITGDSDSTGSVTGALMGALLGVDAIPREWREQVENAALLTQLANDLYRAN
ncbi:MAG: ADP-ribosylglycohydrolase family protein [Actinomycetia bacterium]|nr:ADP-ribosylglycohydrolase family protein [Actinomycetes bacterium]